MRHRWSTPLNVNHSALLIAVCGLVLGESACMGIGRHGPFGYCTLIKPTPEGCAIAQAPGAISIGFVEESPPSVRDIQAGHVPPAPPSALGVGDTVRLQVYGVTPGDGIHWSSSDNGIAKVQPDPRGYWRSDRPPDTRRILVVAKKVGTATILVRVADQRDSVTVTVHPKPAPTKS